MNEQKDLKKFPHFASDAEAERFVDEADLSNYDFSDMEKMRLLDDLRGRVTEGLATPMSPWAGVEKTLADIRQRSTGGRRNQNEDEA